MTDAAFSGSIALMYERYLVPLVFAPYEEDLARRIAARRPARVLETACGTGVVTRALAAVLGDGAEIVATDLNPPMLAPAATLPIARPVQWKQAYAMTLPFADASFDVLACQFGVMFFPDPPAAYRDDSARIAADLAAGGFERAPRIETVAARSRAESALAPAIAYCQGTPLRNEIEARDASRLDEATEAARRAIAARFGDGPVDGAIRAHVVVVER